MAREVQRYVTNRLVELLGPAEVEKQFDRARGDSRIPGGKGCMLPFDAGREERKLIVEVDERQHGEPVAIFDKPGKLTVSGSYRGEQRRIYDERKLRLAEDRGYRVVHVDVRLLEHDDGRLRWARAADGRMLAKILRLEVKRPDSQPMTTRIGAQP